MIEGKTYLERGRPVVVRVQWGHRARALARRVEANGDIVLKHVSAPRNVLIEREDGSRVVRPFRGLRCP